MGVSQGQPVGPATLQSAYQAQPAAPQISVAAANPLTWQAATASQNVINFLDNAGARGVRVGFTDASIMDFTTTNQGVRLPRLTTVQRDAIGTPLEGLIIFNTDDGQVNQYNGSTWTTPGAGLTTLQGAYDNDPAGAQILLDNVPNPLSVQAQVAGEVFSVLDTGGTKVLEVDSDPDVINARANIIITDPFLNAGAANSLVLTDNVTYTAPFVGGGILSNGTVQYDNSVWIWALLQESKVYRANAAPGFAAFTLFNALASIENQGNFNLVQALVLNVGVVHNRRTAGTSTTAQTIGVSFAAQTRAQVAGAVMTRTTGLTGFSMAPTYNTVAGSTVNLGTIRGMLFAQPAVPLFGSGAGTNNMTAYYGMDFPNMTFGGGSAIYSVVRSALNTGTNKRFLDHIGSASSRLRGHIIFDVDNFGVILGASSDALIRWGATSNALDFFFNSTFQAVEMSMPAAGRMLLDGSVDLEMNFNCVNGFSMGASTGPNGNQFGNWTTGARAVGVPGGYADFLLTQGANLDIGAFAMSDVGAWVLNAISLDNATGSIADLDTLTIGGMTTSNPGITVTRRSALRMTGRKYHRGVEAYPPLRPAALTGDVDDYAPATGNSMRQIWVLETDNLGNRTINGIVPQQTNDTQTIFNDSATDNILLGHEIGSSAAGNRFTLPGAAALTIAPQEAVTIWHDDNDDRWKAINRV